MLPHLFHNLHNRNIFRHILLRLQQHSMKDVQYRLMRTLQLLELLELLVLEQLVLHLVLVQ